MKLKGNKWRAMHLRRKTPVHKYKMEMYSLYSTMGETTGESQKATDWAGAIRIMVLFKKEAGEQDA